MYYSNNPLADFDRYCEDEESARQMHPRCARCSDILEDVVYEIGEELYCEDCIVGAKTRLRYLIAV
jgi:late competence protein required for DNA uptake (superfamily II DNA/RNA helicase)